MLIVAVGDSCDAAGAAVDGVGGVACASAVALEISAPLAASTILDGVMIWPMRPEHGWLRMRTRLAD